MEKTYTSYLYEDVQKSRFALLKALEERDRLKYIEAINLKKEYQEKIGQFEEPVIKKEIEVVTLQEKKNSIQVKINRREEIDIEELNQQMEQRKQEMIQSVEKEMEPDISTGYSIDPQDEKELQSLYKDIVEEFHPEVHELTDNQKYLYEKAVKYYRERKLDELRIAHDMLQADGSEAIEISFSLSTALVEEDEEALAEKIEEFVEEVSEDYSLANELFDSFEPTSEDLVLKEKKSDYEAQIRSVLAEIEAIHQTFPFNAKETLRNEEKLQEYLDSLKMRLRQAEETIQRLTEEINRMLEENGYETTAD